LKMKQRSVSARNGALFSVIGLLGLTIAKGSVGWITGSKALLADACHSAADCAVSLSCYLGLRHYLDMAKRKQAESVSAIVLSAMLLVAGLEVGLASVRSVASGADKAPGWGAVGTIAAGIILREALVRYKRRKDVSIGIRPDRTGENRSDIFASLTAFVGTAGAQTGEMMNLPFLYVLDPAAGLVISVFVLRMGYKLTVGVLHQSDRCVLDEADSQMLLEAVQRVDGVVAVDGLEAREQGHYLVLDVIIRVNPRVSVVEGHDIALRVRRHLTKRFQHISDAFIQVQPYDPGYPYKSNHHEEEMTTLIQ
jgi:cation diffusion facilitator family transporter